MTNLDLSFGLDANDPNRNYISSQNFKFNDNFKKLFEFTIVDFVIGTYIIEESNTNTMINSKI